MTGFHNSLAPPFSQLSIHFWGKAKLSLWSPISTRPHWRLFFSEGEGMEIHSRNQVFNPFQDGPVLIPPGVPITGKVLNTVNHFYLHFQLQDPLRLSTPRIFVMPKDVLLKFDFHVFEKRRPGPENWKLFNLITRCLEAIPQGDWETACSDPSIQSVLDFIEENLHRELSNESLAEFLRMPQYTFVRKFTRVTGDSPQKVVENRRLDRAKTALEHSDMSIEVIAQECGYRNRFYFSNRFKKRFQISPGLYRRKALGLI